MAEPSFVADAMLGKLARWLRILGYDVVYKRGMEDWQVLSIAEKEKRTIITRDLGLHRRAINRGIRSIYVEGQDVAELLAQVALVAGISLSVDFDRTRCPVCNGELRKVAKKEVEGKVPEGVYELYNDFWVCRKCGRIYWVGSHWKTIEEELKRARKTYEGLRARTARGLLHEPGSP